MFQQIDKDDTEEINCEDYNDITATTNDSDGLEPLTVDLDDGDVVHIDEEEGGDGEGQEEIDLEDEGYSECEM